MNVSSPLHALARPALALAAGALCAVVAASPALAQGLGLPRNYDVQRIDTPHPVGGSGDTAADPAAPNFGWGVASADLNRDRDRELLVVQSQSSFDGEIFIFDGRDGRKIDTIRPPEGKGENVELAHVYVETMPDIGSCSGGESSKICGKATPPDGIPEILAGSRALSVDATGKAIGEPGYDATTGKKVGRAYVFDGATRAVLKKIDMPAADRATQSGGANFGRLVMNPSGLPACNGSNEEGNDGGVARCPDLPPGVRLGDVDGGGKPDIVVTARNYQESRTSVAARAPDSQCARSTQTTCTTGRAYVYRGEDVTGSPSTPLDTPYKTIDNPAPQTASQEFGGNVFRVGDVNNDSRPEFLIAARNTDYPLNNPEPSSGTNVGAGFLVDASASQPVIKTFTPPQPQRGAEFTLSFNSGPAPGDLGHTALPDIFLPETFHNRPVDNRTYPSAGRAFVFKGDLSGSGGSEQSFLFSILDDPTPDPAGNFGGSSAGVGDLVPGPDNPANELLLGGPGPYDPQTEETSRIVTDVHFFNATTGRVLQTITDPDRNGGSGFGVGITPMGDLNEDGFLDFGVTSFLSDAPPDGQLGQGRAFIFRSNNTPPPPPPAPLKPGACANEKRGTNAADNLRGTSAGDKIFVFGANDVVDALAGADCIDGGSGSDRLVGGAGDDSIVGQAGDDRLSGTGGNDRVFGVSGNDVLTGGAGRDTLAGAGGNDVLVGDTFDDRLFGEAGQDEIFAGTGSNVVDAGDDNDIVNARNGERDTINCGRGRDTARVDPADRVTRCERVIRPRP